MISFEDDHLQEICQNEFTAQQHLAEDASDLKLRLADLRSSLNVHDYQEMNPVGINSDQTFIVAFGRQSSILLRSNHRTLPIDSHGAVNWQKVRRIRVLEIRGLK